MQLRSVKLIDILGVFRRDLMVARWRRDMADADGLERER